MRRALHAYFIQKTVKKTPLLLLIGVLLLACTSFYAASSEEPFLSPKLVKYYPNPAISYINFEFPGEIDKNYSLVIFSFVGKKMTETAIENNKIVVPLAGYYRGLYVFQLKDKAGRIIETGRFQVIQ
ncbi:T9SS type A sorting domain-containing protein [Filimonas effusa]|uniref:T9SS type A sorting domain-containing protein n=1 Tax=Filimonas effusa TaxID=2508721 RepID=A0A4Q1D362_9BACT|nr:T9SS type A sorting domain-containing protein [Filimonas effusa]RXK82840.1 T9SS type A sorting domain-containing protein [Filimonas effusa]